MRSEEMSSEIGIFRHFLLVRRRELGLDVERVLPTTSLDQYYTNQSREEERT